MAARENVLSQKILDKTTNYIPLNHVNSGTCVKIIDVHSGCGLKRRLNCLGLTYGSEIEVVHGALRGPIIVNVRGSRVALGCGMSSKILVEPIF